MAPKRKVAESATPSSSSKKSKSVDEQHAAAARWAAENLKAKTPNKKSTPTPTKRRTGVTKKIESDDEDDEDEEEVEDVKPARRTSVQREDSLVELKKKINREKERANLTKELAKIKNEVVLDSNSPPKQKVKAKIHSGGSVMVMKDDTEYVRKTKTKVVFVRSSVLARWFALNFDIFFIFPLSIIFTILIIGQAVAHNFFQSLLKLSFVKWFSFFQSNPAIWSSFSPIFSSLVLVFSIFSPGKYILGLTVINEETSRPAGLVQLLCRNLIIHAPSIIIHATNSFIKKQSFSNVGDIVSLISLLQLLIQLVDLFMLICGDGRRICDRLAGTTVVKKQEISKN